MSDDVWRCVDCGAELEVGVGLGTLDQNQDPTHWDCYVGRLRAEVELLNQIVMAVGRKYPGEERWETALRYVREMESFCTTAQAQANRPRPVEAPDE